MYLPLVDYIVVKMMWFLFCDRYGKLSDRKDTKVEIKQEVLEPTTVPAVKKFRFSLDSNCSSGN
jgi:type III secretory pathway component EscU